MLKIKTIILSRAEGSVGDLESVTVHNWTEATEVLRRWATTAPKAGDGYHKCDFLVEWEDGEVFEGRYDLEHFTVKTPNFAHFFRRMMMFASGNAPKADWKPTWTPEIYQMILARTPSFTQWAKAAWNSRDVGRSTVTA